MPLAFQHNLENFIAFKRGTYPGRSKGLQNCNLPDCNARPGFKSEPIKKAVPIKIMKTCHNMCQIGRSVTLKLINIREHIVSL